MCLRLVESGRENWYLPEVELYHLEGHSRPTELKQLTDRYNRWLHTNLHRTLLERIGRQFAAMNASAAARNCGEREAL